MLFMYLFIYIIQYVESFVSETMREMVMCKQTLMSLICIIVKSALLVMSPIAGVHVCLFMWCSVIHVSVLCTCRLLLQLIEWIHLTPPY